MGGRGAEEEAGGERESGCLCFRLMEGGISGSGLGGGGGGGGSALGGEGMRGSVLGVWSSSMRWSEASFSVSQ